MSDKYWLLRAEDEDAIYVCSRHHLKRLGTWAELTQRNYVWDANEVIVPVDDGTEYYHEARGRRAQLATPTPGDAGGGGG